jgi:hypothetical protein
LVLFSLARVSSDERVNECSLDIPSILWLSCGADHAGVGLGAMDQAAAAIVDDPINAVIRRVSLRVGIGPLCVMGDGLW